MPPRLRVLHLLEPPDGGVAKHLRDLVPALIARGHHVDAIVSPGHGLADALRQAGAGVALAGYRMEMTRIDADVRVLRRLAALMRSRRWDLVHTHGNKGGALGRPVARMCGLPVVHSSHGFAYLGQLRRDRRGRSTRRALTLGVERALAPLAEVIVCASEDERQQAVADGVAPRERFVVVHNGIADPAPCRPDPRLAGGPGDPPLLGYLARLSPEKGALLFVDTLARLQASGAAFRAAIVGDGPQAREVRARIAGAGLSGNVVFLPWDGDPFPALAAFDVYVLPSLMESLPIGLLEAMAAGLPAVAADVGGVREAVLHERTGVLFPPGDGEALQRALERMLTEPRREEMGRAAREHWRREFTLETMVDGIEHAYRRARWSSAR